MAERLVQQGRLQAQQRRQLAVDAGQRLALAAAFGLGQEIGVAQFGQQHIARGEVLQAAEHAQRLPQLVAVGREPDVQHPRLAVHLGGDFHGDRLAKRHRLLVALLHLLAALGREPLGFAEGAALDIAQADSVVVEEWPVAHQQASLRVPDEHGRGRAVEQGPEHPVFPHLLRIRRAGFLLPGRPLPGEGAAAPGDLHHLDGRLDVQLLLQAHLVGADGLVADR
ncbi:hypothetical protein D9M73_187070 [compost metagenome]